MSRQFRRVAHEHSFWQEDDFNFEDLIQSSYCRAAARSFDWDDEFRRIIHTVLPIWLDDPVFVSCLARKTSWWFLLFDVFAIVMKSVPDFLYQMRDLCLGRLLEGIHLYELLTMSDPPVCVNVTSLELQAFMEYHKCTPGDLTLLRNLFPGLKTLHISPSSCYTGNLHGFDGLTELVLNDYRPGNDCLIPYNSRDTLVRLGFTESFFGIFSKPPVINELDVGKDLFQRFTNIQYLEIYPLHRGIETALQSIHCRPFSLDVSFPTDCCRDFLAPDLLSISCFRHLQEVTLGPAAFENEWETGLWELDPGVFESILQHITSLCFLRKLVIIKAHFDIAWLRLFKRLKKLETLTWSVWELADKSEWARDWEIKQSAFCRDLNRTLHEVFGGAEFEGKPDVSIRFDGPPGICEAAEGKRWLY